MVLIATSIVLLIPLLWVQKQTWQDNLELPHITYQRMMQMREIRDQLSIQLNQQTENLFQLQCKMGNDVSCNIKTDTIKIVKNLCYEFSTNK